MRPRERSSISHTRAEGRNNVADVDIYYLFASLPLRYINVKVQDVEFFFENENAYPGIARGQGRHPINSMWVPSVESQPVRSMGPTFGVQLSNCPIKTLGFAESQKD